MVVKLEKNTEVVINSTLPRAYHFSVTFLEIISVIFLAVYCSKIFLSVISPDIKPFKMAPRLVNDLNLKNKRNTSSFNFLTSTDPFYRSITLYPNDDMVLVPESTLDIQIFGIRSSGNGKGTAILKVQGELQKLAQIGDEIAPGVRMTAVHKNRIEFSRNGIVETTYLIKNKTNHTNTQNTQMITETAPFSSEERRNDLEAIIEAMDLSPYRSGPQNRIRGFSIGQDAKEAVLQTAGLEIGDIINSVNGNELISWERVREISMEFGSSPLDIQLERHGEILSLTLSQISFGQ